MLAVVMPQARATSRRRCTDDLRAMARRERSRQVANPFSGWLSNYRANKDARELGPQWQGAGETDADDLKSGEEPASELPTARPAFPREAELKGVDARRTVFDERAPITRLRRCGKCGSPYDRDATGPGTAGPKFQNTN